MTNLEEVKAKLSEYLLSDEYFDLLERAVQSRIRTTSKNFDKHAHVISLMGEFKRVKLDQNGKS